MKPGPKKTQIQGMYAIALAKMIDAAVARIEPFADMRSIPDLEALSAVARYLDGTKRLDGFVAPHIRAKPLKAKKRRAYSAATQATLQRLVQRLEIQETIIEACNAEGVERSRFERYLRLAGYGDVIERNARAKIAREAQRRRELVAKPKAAAGRPTNYPAR